MALREEGFLSTPNVDKNLGGRPKKKRKLTSTERQRRWRRNKSARAQRERARKELTDPEYYRARFLPALLWGAGTTGVGSEVGKLVTPGGKVPERARAIVDRGSDK